jgi:putative transposase
MTKKQNSHVVEFPLTASKKDIKTINIKFDVARQLYNSTLSELLRRSQEMRSSPQWSLLIAQNKTNKSELTKLNTIDKPDKNQKNAFDLAENEKKRISKAFYAVRKAFLVSEYALNNFSKMNKNACYFGQHLDANTIQKIDKRVMDAFDKWCFKAGRKPRFKAKNRAFKSLEGKTNKQGMRFVIGNEKQSTHLAWMGLTLPVIFSKKDNHGYQPAALTAITEGNIAFTRIVKKVVKGQEKFYVQVILKGAAFVKAHHETAFKKAKGKRVGTDLGVSSLAYYGEKRAGLLTGVSEIKDLQRK